MSIGLEWLATITSEPLLEDWPKPSSTNRTPHSRASRLTPLRATRPPRSAENRLTTDTRISVTGRAMIAIIRLRATLAALANLSHGQEGTWSGRSGGPSTSLFEAGEPGDSVDGPVADRSPASGDQQVLRAAPPGGSPA